MEVTHSHWHWFWIIPILFMILMCVFGSLLCRRAYNRQGDSGARRGWGPCGSWGSQQNKSQTPSQILDKRYASGEITREHYEQMKRDLG